MASSASAAVGPRPHEVYMYKVEKHVDLSGEYPDNYSGDVYLSCNDGDYALDGMWRVDHVDQPSTNHVPDSTAIYNDERDVIFYTSVLGRPTSQWHYRFENFADGNAQVKLFLTCIRHDTEQTAGHTHGIVLTDLYYKSYGTGYGTSTFGGRFRRRTATPTTTSRGSPPRPETPATTRSARTTTTRWRRASTSTTRTRCGTKNWLFRSYISDDGKSWNWAFLLRDVSSNIHLNVGYRCLRDYVANTNGGGSNHSHQLPITFRPSNGPSHYHPYLDYYLDHGFQERRYSCDDGSDGAKYQDYKAMVARLVHLRPAPHVVPGHGPAAEDPRVQALLRRQRQQPRRSGHHVRRSRGPASRPRRCPSDAVAD